MAYPTRATKNWPNPGQKFFTRTHHYDQLTTEEEEACIVQMKIKHYHSLINFIIENLLYFQFKNNFLNKKCYLKNFTVALKS